MTFGVPRLPAGSLYPEPGPVVSVWVDLAAVFVHPASAPRTVVPDGLDLTAKAKGMLDPRSWRRAGSGMWVALCTIDIPYMEARASGGRGAHTYRLERQLVPGYALSPRSSPRL